MLLQRRSDEQMFIPANSIAHALSHDVVHEDHVKSKPPLHSIDEDTASDGEHGNEQQTSASTSLTAILRDDENNKTANADIVDMLKEVCNMVPPDFTDIQLPNERNVIDVKLLGERTREHLNSLYRSSILNSARNKALHIGISNKWLL